MFGDGGGRSAGGLAEGADEFGRPSFATDDAADVGAVKSHGLFQVANRLKIVCSCVHRNDSVIEWHWVPTLLSWVGWLGVRVVFLVLLDHGSQFAKADTANFLGAVRLAALECPEDDRARDIGVAGQIGPCLTDERERGIEGANRVVAGYLRFDLLQQSIGDTCIAVVHVDG